MPARVRLTDAAVGKLRARPAEYTVWDTRMAGLGVRVRPTGSRSYVYLGPCHGGARGPRKHTLGPTTTLSADDARRACLDLQTGTRPESARAAANADPPMLFRVLRRNRMGSGLSRPVQAFRPQRRRRGSPETAVACVRRGSAPPDFTAGCPPVVRPVQRDRARWRQLDVAIAPLHPAACRAPRASSERPDPHRPTESTPQAHALSLAGRDPHPAPASRRKRRRTAVLRSPGRHHPPPPVHGLPTE